MSSASALPLSLPSGIKSRSLGAKLIVVAIVIFLAVAAAMPFTRDLDCYSSSTVNANAAPDESR